MPASPAISTRTSSRSLAPPFSLSLIDGAIAVGVEAARDNSPGSTTILQNTNQLSRAAEIALENSINIPPTIHVDQGTPIQVFVARDLDFRNVSPEVNTWRRLRLPSTHPVSSFSSSWHRCKRSLTVTTSPRFASTNPAASGSSRPLAVAWNITHMPELDERHIVSLAKQVAASTRQAVTAEHPLLSAALPSGERIQVVLPPCAPAGGVVSIRKQTVRDLSLNDYVNAGAFESTVAIQSRTTSVIDDSLAERLALNEHARFVRDAVQARKNILVAGGTSSGKTTFLNAIAKEIPSHERLVTIEDTPEVELAQPNRVTLIASKGDQGEARVDIQQLLEATLRLRPDRILLGELRGAEAYTFLRAVNTGHPGSVTTLHADSPSGAFEQLALMVLQTDKGLHREEIMAYVKSIVDIVIQVQRTPSGQRVVNEIYFPRGAYD